MSDRFRLTLDLSKRLNDRLGTIADELETSRADLVRTALEMLIAAKEARDDGLKVGAWGPGKEEGTQIQRVFLNPVTGSSA